MRVVGPENYPKSNSYLLSLKEAKLGGERLVTPMKQKETERGIDFSTIVPQFIITIRDPEINEAKSEAT